MANGDVIDLDESVAAGAAEGNAGQIDDLTQENADGTYTMQLKYPVTVRFKQGGQEREEKIEQLQIRRANGGDLRIAIRHQKDEEKLTVMLFQRLTGLVEPVFDALDADDITRFTEVLGRFLPQSPATGTKS